MMKPMSRVGALALTLALTGACSGNAPPPQSAPPAAPSANSATPARPWTDAKRSWINGSANWDAQRGEVVLVEAWHPT